MAVVKTGSRYKCLDIISPQSSCELDPVCVQDADKPVGLPFRSGKDQIHAIQAWPHIEETASKSDLLAAPVLHVCL